MRPSREAIRSNEFSYFVSTQTAGRRSLFQVERWARLMVSTINHYDGTGYKLHAYVVMPDHLHLLITPIESIEKSMQLIKGGFSYQAKKELGSNMEIWRRGFADHRIRDAEDYDKHLHYIHLNPVKKHLCTSPSEYRYSSAYPGWKLDPIPQGLKPEDFIGTMSGTAEAVPFQDTGRSFVKEVE